MTMYMLFLTVHITKLYQRKRTLEIRRINSNENSKVTDSCLHQGTIEMISFSKSTVNFHVFKIKSRLNNVQSILEKGKTELKSLKTQKYFFFFFGT